MVTLSYIVRPGESNEELRFSLRSVVANWPTVDRIIIVGHLPTWLVNVEFVPGNRFKDKQRNVYDNVYLCATHPTHDEELVVMNDDFFIVHPVTDAEMAYRSTLAEHIASLGAKDTWWRRSLKATETWLTYLGSPEPLLSYELHRPFPIVADQMAKALHEARQMSRANPPQWRTLYGNRWQVPAVLGHDAKVYTHREHVIQPDQPFLSTTDASWWKSDIGNVVRERFPDRSPFEKVIARAH